MGYLQAFQQRHKIDEGHLLRILSKNLAEHIVDRYLSDNFKDIVSKIIYSAQGNPETLSI